MPEKLKHFLVSLICIFSCISLHAQKITTFQEVYNTYSYDGYTFPGSVIELSDKGFIFSTVQAHATSIVPDLVIIITRTDSIGRVIWSKEYSSGSAYDDLSYNYFFFNCSLSMVRDGNIMVGATSGSQLLQNYAYGNASLFKIDLNGNVLWSDLYRNNIKSGRLGASISNMQQDFSGNFVFTGSIENDGSGFIAKTDQTGTLQWANSYIDTTSTYTNGQIPYWNGIKVIPSRKGGYLAGTTCLLSYNSFGMDYRILKLNSNGKLLWSMDYGSNNSETLASIIELPDKSFYVFGNSGNFSTFSSIFGTVQKLDSTGKILWSKKYPYSNSANLIFASAIYDSARRLFKVTGNFETSLADTFHRALISLDTSGALSTININSASSRRCYYNGIWEDGFLIDLKSGGMAILSGSSQTAPRQNAYNEFNTVFLKTDSLGNTESCGSFNLKLKPANYPVAVHDSNLIAQSKLNFTKDTGMTVNTYLSTDSILCPPFVAWFGWKDTCSGVPTHFYDSTYCKATNWYWNFGDTGSLSNTSTLKNPSHTYGKAGIYSVKLVAGNGTVKDSVVRKVTIYQKPVFFNFDTVICGGNAITLKANGGVTYQWSPSIWLSSATAATPTANLPKTSIYTVKATTIQGCNTTDSMHITVDNKPAAPVIEYATVKSNNEIDVRFQRSDSNDVKRYEIYRAINGGIYKLLDTVPDLSDTNNIYLVKDSSINAASNIYSYKVVALDSCGALGDTSAAHTTMLLAVKQLGCLQTLQLNWGHYIGWSSIKNYEIFRNVNGGPDSLIATLSNAISNYNDTGLNHKNIYCYKIKAIDNADSFVSQSNIICKQTFFPDTPQVLSVSKISTSTTNGTVVIKWNSINKRNLAYNALFFSRDGNNFSETGAHFSPGIDSFAQNSLDTKDSDYFYNLVTVDSCGAQSIKSPISKTMTLRVSVGELLHKLNWTPYIGFKIKEYKIERFEKGQFVTIDSVPGTDTFSREFPAPCNYAIRYRIAAIGYDSGEIAWSDTMGRQAIDTIPSDPPIIINATVLNGTSARINFVGSDSLDTYEFAIQRSVDGSWGTAGAILFTKPGDVLQYIDSNANTLKDQICYTVITLDSCLNASSSDTICLERLTGSGLFCNTKAQLNWPAFTKPPRLPDSLLIYRSVDDIHFNKVALLPPVLLSYVDTAVTVGQQYYYTMSTVYKSGMVSYSDTINIIPKIIPEADSAQLVYATVLKSDEINGAVYIKWKRAMLNDTNARGYYLYSFNSTNGKYALLKDITDLNDTTFINSNINTIKDVNKYYVLTYNVCDVGINSNIHRTVLLNVQGKNLSEQLNWINYLGVPVKNYSIYKSIDGGIQSLVKNIGTDSSYLDSNIACNHNITYQIQAILANGEVSFSDSITVKSYDSIKPKTGPLILATVINKDMISLKWNPAIDHNLLGYNVYRSVDGLYWSLIIGHWPGTSLIDSGLDTYDQSYYYKIQPIDSCGNLGPFTIYHETIHLRAKASTASTSSATGRGYIQLSWNGYLGWPVKKYLLYRDGILIDSFANNQFAYKDSSIICNTNYQYLIKAIDSINDTIISASNMDSARAANHIPPQKVYIKTVTVSKPNKAATITWSPSISFDVKDYLVYRKSAETGNLKFVDSSVNLTYTDSFRDIPASIRQIRDPDCYYVFARDHCNNISDGSNQGCIIILDAKNQAGYNLLSWNSYQNWSDGIKSYNVYKNEDSTGWQLIGTVSPLPGRGAGGEAFKDGKLGDSTIDFCYQVEAIENPGQYNQLSRSTVECVHQDATVFIPNSFTPYNQDGLNDFFGPKGLYIKSYDMKIFNRWGEMIYSEQIPLASRAIGTGSPKGEEAGWDGTFRGQPVQQGIYIYMITVTDYNGKQSYFKGTVTMFE